MKLHANARTCPKSRALIAGRVFEEGWSLAAAAEAAGVSVVTARKWVRRAAAGESLEDRSSVPRRVPSRTPRGLVEAIAALRRLRMTAVEIAELLGMALSTVSLWLKRIGLGKRSRLEPPEPPNRYERARPGELVHVDIKQLGRISERGAGYRVVGHRGSQIKRRERGPTRADRLRIRARDGRRPLPTRLRRGARRAQRRGGDRLSAPRARLVRRTRRRGRALMTDNGSAYVSHAHRQALRELGIRHLTTRPYRPRTNGKAERFIRPAQRMGLRAHLRQLTRTHPPTRRLARALQLPTTTRLPRPPTPATRINNLVGNYT